MDKANWQIAVFRLLKISEMTTDLLNALDDDETAQIYCREIWDAVASLSAHVDKLSTCG